MGLDWIGKWQDVEEAVHGSDFVPARIAHMYRAAQARAENGPKVGRGGTSPACDSRRAALLSPPCRPVTSG